MLKKMLGLKYKLKTLFSTFAGNNKERQEKK
jgi:hypothetical protein